MTQSIEATVDGLFVRARDVVYVNEKGADGNPVLVSIGEPGVYQAFSIVAIASEIRMPITRPTMGTNRSRSQDASEIDCVISVYVPGDERAQAPAMASALALQKLLENNLRVSDQTFGGACLDSFVSQARLVPSIAWTRPMSDDPEIRPVATGRLATNFVTVSAFIRY